MSVQRPSCDWCLRSVEEFDELEQVVILGAFNDVCEDCQLALARVAEQRKRLGRARQRKRRGLEV